MSIRIVRGAWAAQVLAAGLVLAGCGGGGSSAPPALGKIVGSVVASTDSAPVADAKVSVGAQSAQTAADGSFTIADVPAASRVVLKVEATGYVDGLVTLPLGANQTARVAARLTGAGAVSSVDPTAANTVTAAGSTARVALPANALVNPATGAAPTGPVSVQVTALDPATDPQSMPGDFTASSGDTIESFGAINVVLRDGAGAKLNLKAGSTATIRIPLSSRSVNPPATIPLYYMNEATGLWVLEGSATLGGSGADRYYEGTVTHFTTWNADQEQLTIFVNGCVVNDAGQPVAGAVANSVGIDYSGSAYSNTDAAGKFRVAMRKSSRATIYAETSNASNTVVAGQSEVDTTLPNCLVIGATPLGPTILEQPGPQSIAFGGVAYFIVSATGARPLAYQWRRNGVDIPSATGPLYIVFNGQVGDSGALYSVVVSNVVGSVTSAAALLSVAAPVAPSITTPPASLAVAAGAAANFSVVAAGTAPLAYQWQRNGVDIPGATAASYSIPLTAIGDNGAVFRVRVSNVANSVTSAGATLTVTGPALSAPTITAQPGNVSVAPGQTANFGVAVTGSPVPTFQWRRDGTDIPGATAASYTTPATSLADNGAVFSVVVANSQGSVTSNGATLTVSAQSTDAKINLLRLLGLTFEFYGASALPFEAIDDATTGFVNPQSRCTTGTLAVTLGGTPVVAAQPVPQTGTLAATATACDIDGTTYTGSSSVAFNFTSLNPQSGSATLSGVNMRSTTQFFDGTNTIVDSDISAIGGGALVATGSIAGPNTISVVTLTPDAGATLRNELTATTAAFASGSTAITVTETTATGQFTRLRIGYNSLTFSVAGLNYVGNGFYELDFSSGLLPFATGEVILTGNGVQIGRIFGDANGALQLEVDGMVQPFKAPRAAAARR